MFEKGVTSDVEEKIKIDEVLALYNTFTHCFKRNCF